ncbi:MAG: TRAP transporter large permease subunit [Proteobacteria bacterium]|nr:TRAP transporter large permease subunit [Pseudomonadota bacterium]NIS70209.1 TRAP transporter large permease subunit [Pseudomonadota bacterium]
MIASVFTVLLALGIPIAFVLGISSVLYLWKTQMPFVLVSQRVFVGLDNFLLLAVPLFILAGKLMNASGITRRLVDFFYILIGHIRGGLAYVNIIASVFFAGITGAGAADTAAIGSIMIPAMKKEGYSSEYSGAVTAISSTIGPTIPPSIAMVVYGAMAETSIARLFLAGFIPGLLLGFAQLLVAAYFARRQKFPVRQKVFSIRSATAGFINTILAILMPIILLGGILSGVFTPTEAAGVAVFYSLIVGFFIYRELKISSFLGILYETSVLAGTILIILAMAHLFGWILAAEAVPEFVAVGMTSVTKNPVLILLLINILLLFVGTIMETLAAIILLTPILLPLAQGIGIDPVHFGVIMVVNLNIGLATPPLGVCLIVASPIAKVPLERIAFSTIPFLIASIGVLFVITYVPQLVMFVPNLFMR